MIVFYFTLGFVALYFIFMSVRLIFLKDGQFKGTCASQNPYLQNEGTTCGFCGREVGSCEDESDEPISEVTKVLSKF